MRRQQLREVYRVRGYDDRGNVRWSRMFARRADAVRWFWQEWEWFPRVTLEHSPIDGFTEVELHPWEVEP